MTIPRFGWLDGSPPAISAENLEALLAASGQYTDGQIAEVVSKVQTTVTTFNGRSGTVLPQAGDYAISQITGLSAQLAQMTSQISQLSSGSSVPINSVAPVISGTAQVGLTLTCTPGTWGAGGSGAPTITHQWQTATSTSGPWTSISGATTVTETLSSAMVGDYISCLETATYSGLSSGVTNPGPVRSNILGVVSAANALNASPTGPAIPTNGWSVAFADTFSNGALDTTMWLPNHLLPASTNQQGDNSNDNLQFNSSQVSVNSNGLQLTCINASGLSNDAAGFAENYLSGYVHSGPNSLMTANGNASGWASKGFALKLDTSTMWSVEWLGTLPINEPGNGGDMSLWMAGVPYNVECDLFENWFWNSNYPTGGTSLAASAVGMTPITWFNVLSNGNPDSGSNFQQAQCGYGSSTSPLPSACTDNSQHRWTWLFNPSSKTVTTYMDGAVIATISYPASWGSAYMVVLMEYGLRIASSFTGPRVMSARSLAFYYRTGDSPQYIGGGLAAGTTVSSTGGGPVVATNPAISTLTAFDTTHFYYGSGASESSGTLTVPVVSAYTGFNTIGPYVFAGSTMSVEMAMAAGNGGKEIYFGLGDKASGSSNGVGFHWDGNNLKPYSTVSGTTTFGTAISVSGSVYVRVAEVNGTTTWSYSTNGTTWTTAQSQGDPLSATIMAAMYVNGSVGYYDTESASNATLSNFN